jgi:hypothetical protein
VSWLSKYTEKDLLSINRDEEVNRALAVIGYDLDEPILYAPALHRDMTGHTEIGYLIYGSTQINRSWIDSPFASLTERLEAVCYRDVSLFQELAKLGCAVREYGGEKVSTDDFGYEPEDLPPDQLEPDWKESGAEIEKLVAARDEIRGTCYSESGALKTPSEYLSWMEAQEFYEQKYN